MKHFLIISGGEIEDEFACRWIKEEQPSVVIAADSGLAFLHRNRILPDIIVGDFDSAERETVDAYRELDGVELIELNPVKDDTDTESAVRLALRYGAEKITILGGTGSRLDHVLGNIQLLGIGLEAGVPIVLLDARNRIRMVNRGITLRKEAQFGTYVSLIPYTGEVNHVCLSGFRYPLRDYCLRGFCSIGVSNEIVDQEAVIDFDGGILIVIESKD